MPIHGTVIQVKCDNVEEILLIYINIQCVYAEIAIIEI